MYCHVAKNSAMKPTVNTTSHTRTHTSRLMHDNTPAMVIRMPTTNSGVAVKGVAVVAEVSVVGLAVLAMLVVFVDVSGLSIVVRLAVSALLLLI